MPSALAEAMRLLLGGDPHFWEIVGLSLKVTLSALALATLAGLPAGAALAVARFPGRTALTVLLNAMMGLPPVVIGLLVYLLVSNTGPLGWMGLLYTPGAMIFAQALLITPIVAALARQTIEDLDAEYDEQLRLMGLGTLGRVGVLLWDGRLSLVTAVLAGFGRAVAEVGAVIIVGGNIAHVTRTMTTSIVLETSKGDIALALGLGLVLILIAIMVNAAAVALQVIARRLAYA